jgi:hypothetical protein
VVSKKLEDLQREIVRELQIREEAEVEPNRNLLALTHARSRIKSLNGEVEKAKAAASAKVEQVKARAAAELKTSATVMAFVVEAASKMKLPSNAESASDNEQERTIVASSALSQVSASHMS